MSRASAAPARLWDLAYVVFTLGLAAAFAYPVYSTWRVFLVALLGGALGVGLVLLARRFRWPGWLTMAVGVLGYAVAVVPLAIPSALASPAAILRGVLDGLMGVALGWKQVLTLTLPLGDYQAVLVPLLVVSMLGTMLATACVVAGGRWLVAVIPITALMCAYGLVFGSSATSAAVRFVGLTVPAPREVLLGLAFVLVSLVWLVGRSRLERRRALAVVQATADGVRQSAESRWPAVRRQVLAVVLVIVAVAAGMAVSPVAATWAEREAIRDRIDPVVLVQQEPSPLGRYRAWFAGEAFISGLFTVDGDLGEIDRIRLATLGRYDGDVFRAGASDGELQYSRLPQRGDASGSLKVTIGDGYAGIWMPIPGRLTSAPTFGGPDADTLADTFYAGGTDHSAIIVADRGDERTGLRPGDSYRVLVGPDPDTAQLEDARGADALIDPEAHPALAEWVELQGVTRTGAGLLELVDRLRARGYLSHAVADDAASAGWIADLAARTDYVFTESYSGHSTARIETLFIDLLAQQRKAGEEADDEMLIAAVGDDEQFAAAAALLARHLGFDSRVVIGARLAETDEALAVPSCVDGVCTGANMSAWIEVLEPGGDWIPVDVSPQFTVRPTEILEGEQLPQNPTVPQTVHSEVLDPPPAQRDDAEGAAAEDDEGATWADSLLPILRAVGVGMLAAGLLVLPFAFLPLAKAARRRARRRENDPELSIVGAWGELLDEYSDYGVDVPATATRTDVAASLGRPAAVELAAIADAAVFAEHAPARDAAGTAWAIVDAERNALAVATRRRDRVAAALSPASFTRHLRPRAAVGAGLVIPKRKQAV